MPRRATVVAQAAASPQVSGGMKIFDLLYVAVFAVGLPLYDHLASWPVYVRRTQVEPARARAWLWSTCIVYQWVLVVIGAGYWSYAGRPWSELKLTVPGGWRLAVAVALPLAFSAYQLFCILQLRRDPALRERLRATIGDVADVVPHTRSEVPLFTAVSITAGFCEEFLYRGYLLWTLAPWLGWWGAAALSVPLFALAHSYQGWRGLVRTGIAGAIYVVLVGLLDSLWPVIALHVAVDASAGVMSWLALRDRPNPAAPGDAMRAQAVGPVR